MFFLSGLGRLVYCVVRFLPGELGSLLRVESLRLQGIQIGRFVHIGIGTLFHLPTNPQSVKGSIGDRVSIDEFGDLSAGVYIGDDVSIGK